jgi:hypothetical protein
MDLKKLQQEFEILNLQQIKELDSEELNKLIIILQDALRIGLILNKKTKLI